MQRVCERERVYVVVLALTVLPQEPVTRIAADRARRTVSIGLFSKAEAPKDKVRGSQLEFQASAVSRHDKTTEGWTVIFEQHPACAKTACG